MILVLVLASIGPLPLYSQLNIKIGYVPAIGSFSTINNYLDQYNLDNVDVIETGFKNLNFLNGIDAGFRYKFGRIAVEGSWSNMNKNRSVLLYNSGSDSFTDRQYKFSLSSLALGMDTYFDRFGLGCAIHNQKLKISRNIESNNLQLISENQYAVDLHFNYLIQSGDVVSLVLKPYYRKFLGDFDLDVFGSDLLGNGSAVDSGNIDFFGICLIFYNGKHE